MQVQCPSCAKLAATPECPRCGSELSPLFALQQTAKDEIQRGAALLRQGHPASAGALASRSWERRHSPDAARLAFLAAIGTGDFEAATYWHPRGQTP